VHRVVLVGYTISLIRAIDTVGIVFSNFFQISYFKICVRLSEKVIVSSLLIRVPCIQHSDANPHNSNPTIGAEEGRKKHELYRIPSALRSSAMRKTKLAISLEKIHIS